MRRGLNVDTRHSGTCRIPVLRHVRRESYNKRVAIYERLQRLGMDPVSVSDRGSTGAVERPRSCADLTGRDRIEPQRRAPDFEARTWTVAHARDLRSRRLRQTGAVVEVAA